MEVKVIGAGLAGCEASYQLAKRNIKVKLYEMKPHKKTEAHQSDLFAELVCSNSLRSDALHNAVGVLKQEMTLFDSLIMKAARACAVPAGDALAVDREQFAKYITSVIKKHENIEVVEQEVDTIEPDQYTIVCSGPLTSDSLSKNILELLGDDQLYFYDAAAPIIEKDSIDFSKVYYKSRYDKNNDNSYINCPMNEQEFNLFYDELIKAECVPLKEFEKEIFFEGCMPFEEMARRGRQTLLFGPMKPVGLEREGYEKPFAVVQLRQDNAVATLYNIVGFQTHLRWKEQDRIIQLIPGLQQANIVRYGVMHKNTYICSPNHLNQYYQTKKFKKLFFAGQITGVEGYLESASSGLVSAIQMARLVQERPFVDFDRKTMMGALSYYIANAASDNFQPMNINFGLMPALDVRVKKRDRKDLYGQRALALIEEMIEREEF